MGSPTRSRPAAATIADVPTRSAQARRAAGVRPSGGRPVQAFAPSSGVHLWSACRSLWILKHPDRTGTAQFLTDQLQRPSASCAAFGLPSHGARPPLSEEDQPHDDPRDARVFATQVTCLADPIRQITHATELR